MGSGPYTLVSSGADRASFKRFDDYWDGAPRAAGFQIVAISSTPTRLNALRSGSVDWIFVNLDAAADIKQLETDPGFRVEQVPTRSVFSLHVNTDRAPLNDPVFRRAVSLATDRAAISTSLLGGMREPTTQPLGSGEGRVTGIQEPLQRDLERARALLAESSVGDRSFEVAVASGTAAERIAQAMQAQLAEAGITMKIKAADGRSVRPLFREEKVDALLQQVNAEIDPLIQLRLNYAGPDAPGGTAPELQELLDKAARLEPGSAERTPLLEEVSRRLVEDPVHVVLCAVPNTHIGRADVVGMDDMPMRTVLNPADVRTLLRS